MTVYNKFDNESTSKKASLVEAQNPNFKDPYYISKRGIVLSIIIPLGLLISVLLLHHIYAKMFHFEHLQYDNIIIDDSTGKSLSEAFILTSTKPTIWQKIVHWFTSSVHENYKLRTCCVHKLFWMSKQKQKPICVHNMLSSCSPHVLS